MMVCDGEIVGLCIYRRPPKNGRVEIGYGIAASRRGLGHARRAVAALIEAAARDHVSILTAETSVSNPASARVLEQNGFVPRR